MNQSIENNAINPIEYLVDMARKGYRIFMIGEPHNSKKAHRFLRENIRTLKEQLGLEFLAVELDQSLQDEVRRYMESEDQAYADEFERGLRKGTDYSKILLAARDCDLDVVCIDNRLPSIRDKVMCEAVPDGTGVIYAGGAHAANKPGFLSLGFYLCHRFGEESVLSVFQEDEETLEGKQSEEVGFLRKLNPNQLPFNPALFDKKDEALYNILNRFPELKKDPFFAVAWFANYDGILYHPKT